MMLMTMQVSLASPAFFTPSIYAFQRTTQEFADSAARLASGIRLLRAGDDVSALSISTRLQSQISGLKQASQNAALGNSLLQTASGGLTQIGTLLESMRALAVQADSSGITDADRALLQAQFAEYQEEIDRIATSTEFNDINLIDGSLAGSNRIRTETDAATKAQGSISFTANPTGGQTVVLNGVTLTAGADFAVGGSTAATVANILAALTSSTDTRLSQASYTLSGTTITIKARSGGELGEQYVINRASSTTSFTVVGNTTNAANVYTLSGGLNDGLGVNSVTAVGNIGDALATAQSQTAASVTLSISGAINNNEELRIDNGNGGIITFTFKAAASAATDIQIGASTEETLQNAIETITQYSEDNDNSDNYGLRQLEFTISGSNLVITNRNVGNATDLSGNALDISETLTNGSLSAAAFSNGTNTGVNVSGVNNSSFYGTIEGFSATYVSNDVVDVTLVVGGHTYSARISDTTPGANTTVRFASSAGGYFDVQLAAGGLAVTDQTTADTYAGRLDNVFSGLTFYQDRKISNLQASGDFTGASASIQLQDFGTFRIEEIDITAVGDATIDITINGEVFRATSQGTTFGAYETISFVSQNNANRILTFTNGDTAQDFSDAADAADFEEALREAFGLSAEGAGADFSVGTDVDDVINVALPDVTAESLFNGLTLDISTEAGAITAQDKLDNAIEVIQEAISNVAALGERFGAAGSVIDSSIQGVTEAKSILIDTDIVGESVTFALTRVKISASAAVIAQTKNLQSSLVVNLLRPPIPTAA